MIIIQNSDHFRDEPALLQLLGLEGFSYKGETTLGESIFARDDSVSIGYYNHCIIICPDFRLISWFITDEITDTEKRLMDVFPGVEILAVSCIITTNFHGYVLLKDGRLLRAKALNADDGFYFNTGEHLAEEAAIYAIATSEPDGKMLWHLPEYPEDVYNEDQMMEIFTFGVAKRLLGVELYHAESKALMNETLFRRYVKA